jgi:glutamate-1-semialdehyde 2,1-aminomutase
VRLDEKQVALWRERTPGSLKAWTETKRLIPAGHGGGMGAFSPYPIMLERARGSRVWDIDGNEYLDLRIGDWVNIHGHCDEDVNAAIRRQQERLIQVGGPEWDLGLRFAELLVDRVPSCEKVRFFASGTDANLAAIRLARAATGRERIAKAIGSYHGTADALVVGQSVLRAPGDVLPLGVPAATADQVVEFPYNDPNGAEAVLTAHAGELAAILVEPVLTAAGMIEARQDFLARLREVATREGIVLIFDEVVTFPVAYGGGQAAFEVVPDLTTMGKAIGGGLPVSAVGGRADLLDLLEPDAHDGAAPVSIMATFGGNSLALAAGIAALEKLTPAAHDRMTRLGDRCRSFIDDLGRRHGLPLHATGLGHLVGIHWAAERCVDLPTRRQDDRERIANINLALDNAGFYQTFTGLFLMSTAITEDEVESFLAAFDRALHDLGYVGRSPMIGSPNR